MGVKYYLKRVPGLVLPNRANDTDAGYDIVATGAPTITGLVVGAPVEQSFILDTAFRDSAVQFSRLGYVEYPTNLYFTPVANTNFHTDLRPRSSISKYNLLLANSIGLVDRGYQNQVMCRFKYDIQPEDLRINVATGAMSCVINLDKIYKNGERVAQILPVMTHDIQFELVDQLPGVDRGGGFGSTGH